MKLSSCFLAFLLLVVPLFLQTPPLVDASLEEACKAATSGEHAKPFLTYDFCVTSLQADPHSKSADNRGLAIIAANLSLTNGTSTKSKMERLIKKTTDPFVIDCLQTCLAFYNEAIPPLASSIDAIKSGNYNDAAAKLTQASVGPENCDAYVTEGCRPDSLGLYDDNLEWLISIALSITKSLA